MIVCLISCRWVFKPLQCDLSLVCRVKTREGYGRGNRCSNSDYLRYISNAGYLRCVQVGKNNVY